MPHHRSPVPLEGLSVCALMLFVTGRLAAIAEALTAIAIRQTSIAGATQRSQRPASVRLGNTNMHDIPISASGLPRCAFHEHTRPGGLYSSHLIFTFLNTTHRLTSLLLTLLSPICQAVNVLPFFEKPQHFKSSSLHSETSGGSLWSSVG